MPANRKPAPTRKMLAAMSWLRNPLAHSRRHASTTSPGVGKKTESTVAKFEISHQSKKGNRNEIAVKDQLRAGGISSVIRQKIVGRKLFGVTRLSLAGAAEEILGASLLVVIRFALFLLRHLSIRSDKLIIKNCAQIWRIGDKADVQHKVRHFLGGKGHMGHAITLGKGFQIFFNCK